MNIEEVLGGFVRRLNRQAMDFRDAGDSSLLPVADNSKQYLLYLHIPYCIALCPFCSFHRVLFERNSSKRYFDCLRHEIELATEQGYRFDELYVGGGTPTVLPDELVATLKLVRAKHPIGAISVETNPDHLQTDALQTLRNAGVSRLSVGIQSFDDDHLRAMRRYDNYGSGAVIADRLVNVRGIIDTMNIDMIFNLPKQTEASLRRDLDILIDRVSADQVSFYPLMCSDSNKLDMFDEYIVDREEYVGLGSGAFSYLQGALYANTFSISGYMQMLENGLGSTISWRKMSERDQKRYYLLMRLFGGSLNKESAEARFDGNFQHSLWRELTALKAINAVQDTGDSLILTERGNYLWVILMREFFSEINALREQMRQVSEQ